MFRFLSRFNSTCLTPPNGKQLAAYFSWQRLALLLSPTLLAILFFETQLKTDIAQLETTHTNFTAAMEGLTNGARFIFYVAYALILGAAIGFRDRERLCFVVRTCLAHLLFSLLLVAILKNSFGFPRPGHEGILPPYLNIDGAPVLSNYRGILFDFICLPRSAHQSFPSGHSCDILVSALPLGLYFWNRHLYLVSITVALIGAGTVFSRLWLSAHHPMDTLAGAVIAVHATYFIFRIGVAPKPATA